MDEVLTLEQEHRALKKRLSESLNKKHLIEATINRQFEKLKKLESSLEKMRGCRDDDFQTVHHALMPEQIES